MRLLRSRLDAVARNHRVLLSVIEKDYALGHVLSGIAQDAVIAETLAFKGGTALRKVFFGDYRFSDDLDFSSLNSPRRAALEQALSRALATARRQLQASGPFEVEFAREVLRDPHPGGQELFALGIRFPWHHQPLCRIRIEVTHDEPVVLPPLRLPLIHGYEESLPQALTCYRLEEIVAEKLRALLQAKRALNTRGWAQPRAKDYYDLWRILTDRAGDLDWKAFPPLLAKKAAVRGVSYEGAASFFATEIVSDTARSWEATLGPFVPVLPSHERVIAELRPVVERLLVAWPAARG